MKKAKILKQILVYSILSTSLTACIFHEKVNKDVNYLLFTYSTSVYSEIKDSQRSNTALLITDKQIIEESQKCFLTERSIYHKCGYNYKAFFIVSPDSMYKAIELNSKCESFVYNPLESQKLLDKLGNVIETKPTHYIYNAQVPVNIEPNKVIKDFKKLNLTAYLITDKFNAYPYLKFSFTHNQYLERNKENEETWIEKAGKNNEIKTREIVSHIIEKLDKNKTIVNRYEFGMYTNWFDSLTSKCVMELNFKKNTDINKVCKLLEKEGAEIESVQNPETYFIQIVDTTMSIDFLTKKLEKISYVKCIAKFDEKNTTR